MEFDIAENINLLSLNTFGMEVSAAQFLKIETVQELQNLVLQGEIPQDKPLLILGGGSNILFTQDFPGLILWNKILGVRVVRQDKTSVWVEAGAGVSWHGLVQHCVQNNWGGIENMSLIPGSVGAAPIQNIGAYGVELKDVFECLEAVDLQTGEIRTFNKEECKFGYRESVFKRELNGKYAIVRVCIKLSLEPVLNTSYGDIQAELAALNKSEYSIQDVSEVVCKIRQSKLPDPSVTGNAGSFFKNPSIPTEQYEALKTAYPEMPAYPSGEKSKIPAAWLIQQCGWKGHKRGNYGVHDRQPLVLVNYGGAKGADIYKLSQEVIDSVLMKFGIHLEREVNIL